MSVKQSHIPWWYLFVPCCWFGCAICPGACTPPFGPAAAPGVYASTGVLGVCTAELVSDPYDVSSGTGGIGGWSPALAFGSNEFGSNAGGEERGCSPPGVVIWNVSMPGTGAKPGVSLESPVWCPLMEDCGCGGKEGE